VCNCVCAQIELENHNLKEQNAKLIGHQVYTHKSTHKHSCTESLTVYHSFFLSLSLSLSRCLCSQNPRQKIQHHLKIKQENDTLKSDKKRLAREIRRLHRHIHNISNTDNKPSVANHLRSKAGLKGKRKNISKNNQENILPSDDEVSSRVRVRVRMCVRKECK